MSPPYRIIDVVDWQLSEEEPLGTKAKRWIREPPGLGGRRWLLKYRQNERTGDDWAERIAAEIAAALRLPHAVVELASRDRERAVIVLEFTAAERGDDLHLGNSLLQQLDSGYAAAKRSRNADYTLERTFAALESSTIGVPREWQLPEGVTTPAEVFTGYLLLDALIANQDRNHQNWGAIQRADRAVARPLELVPSFDHASSLGQNLSDSERLGRMETRDRGFSIAAFASKARSKFRLGTNPDRHATTFEAFRWALRRHPAAGRAWLEQLHRVADADLRAMVQAVPASIMSAPSCEFASALLSLNRGSLLAATGEE